MSGHSWTQRLLLALNIIVITACFVGAGGLVVARYYGNSLNRVDLAAPSTSVPVGGTPSGDDAATGVTTGPTGPPETFPDVDPVAKNFLITGADNNSCLDPNSPYASAFGDRSTMGARSDTVMIMRVDPSTKQAAVLSFPRDLWVDIAGRGSKQRINTAYVKNDPQRLIDTIYQNFGIGIDHFIQIDFCAFRTIVNGLGGVAVPFTFPARDQNTGLNVPVGGGACFTFDGDHALAYVRSRKYQYKDTNGKWKTDPVGDLGRVSRQQDFLRRVLSAAIDRGVTDPSVARSLIKAAQQNVAVDRNLTVDRMLEFVGVLRNFEPGGVASYQIESKGAKVGGASVLLPQIKGDNMQAILRIFKGEAPLAGAPQQVFETTTTVAPTTTVRPGTSTTTPGSTNSTTSTTTPPTTTPPTTTTTVPQVVQADPEQNPKGIVPPTDVSC
jgi:LCP family protein required for cell wall assembly